MKTAPLILLGLSLLSACPRQALPPVSEGPSSPYPNIRIDKRYQRVGPCEPSIALDPRDPDRLVAGSVLDNVYRSDDGGKTWQIQRLRSPYGVYGDPVLASDGRGHFYYVHLSDPQGQGRGYPGWLDRIVVQKSADGGETWSEGSYAGLRPPRDQDKPWLAVDPASQHLHLAWTEFDTYGSEDPRKKSRILYARSTDGGDSWSDPIPISGQEGNCLDGDQTPEGAVPAVGPNGEVYLCWAYDERIWLDRSADGGLNWQETDRPIADQPGGWAFDIPGLGRANGLPVTATDLSRGPHRGNIYVSWSDQRNGTDDTDIWLIRSEDGGETWSEPIRVNDDPPGRHQFFSWLSVDPASGFLYLVFYDRRARPGVATDVYLAVSRDGGRTFQNQLISEKPFKPRPDNFFGDYNHIVARDGRVRPVWTRADGVQLSIWTALIDLEE